MKKYDITLEQMMVSYYNSLQERSKRHYAAIEALKLGFGGKKYIAKLFNMSINTVQKGVLELKTGKNTDEVLGSRQRKVGGGRKSFFLPN